MLGGIGGSRKRGRRRIRWLEGIIDSMDVSLSELQGDGDGQGGLACCYSWGHKESDTTERLNWTELRWLRMILQLAQCQLRLSNLRGCPEYLPLPSIILLSPYILVSYVSWNNVLNDLCVGTSFMLFMAPLTGQGFKKFFSDIYLKRPSPARPSLFRGSRVFLLSQTQLT